MQCRTDFVSSGCRAVRSSALAASAALVAGIGTAAVPLLPRIARRALDVVGAALETVTTAEAADVQLAEAPAAEAPDLGSPTGTGSTELRVRSSLHALTTLSALQTTRRSSKQLGKAAVSRLLSWCRHQP
jgi:hypothetical protein